MFFLYREYKMYREVFLRTTDNGLRTTSFAELRIHGESESRSFFGFFKTTDNSQQSISCLMCLFRTTDNGLFFKTTSQRDFFRTTVNGLQIFGTEGAMV